MFVMVLFPGVLNILYFWIADSYLKATPEHAAVHEVDEEKQQAFLEKEMEAKGATATTTSMGEQQPQQSTDADAAPRWSIFGGTQQQQQEQPSSI